MNFYVINKRYNLYKMTTISEFNLGNLMIECIQNMDIFTPKYDADRRNTYLTLNTHKIVDFLADNWTNINYDTEKFSKIINITDKQILEDLKQVLIDSLRIHFNGGYTKNGYNLYIIKIDYHTEKQKLKVVILKQLEYLIFKRAINTSKTYGFM